MLRRVIRPNGMLLTTEDIARIVHETNRAYCEALGDPSQKPWAEAEQWQRDSAIAGVISVLDGTARTPEEQHKAWCEAKLLDGWTFGTVKDAANKRHPCLVDYDLLPIEQQRKDHLFRAVVLSLTEEIEEQALVGAGG